MVYPTFNTIATSSSLAIIKNRDIFFNCPVRIEIFFITFLAFMLSSVRIIDRFSAVYSVSTRSFL
jgi:hypothetical protein